MFYGKLKDQVPLARPVGIVKIRCRCGNKYEFNASRFMSEGFRCKCGFQIEGRGGRGQEGRTEDNAAVRAPPSPEALIPA